MTGPIEQIVAAFTGGTKQSDIALQPRGEGDPVTEHCAICGNAVKTMVFRGTGVCGENCHKKRAGAVEQPKAVSP